MTISERGENDPIVIEAQHVHTEVYLREGYIAPEQLNEKGIFEDEYTPRSEPILVKTGDKETTVRLIHAEKKKGILSLPTPKHFKIDADALKSVAHVTRLSDLKDKDIVEVSGLASISLSGETSKEEAFDATRQAYATALRRSLDQGHLAWVMNLDEKLKKSLSMILGDDALTQIGDEQAYMGPPTIPVALNPQDVVKSILLDEGRFGDMNRADIKQTLQGVSEKHLPNTLVKLLHENDIDTTKESLPSKLWANKKAALYTSIIGYSALRFLPVMAVQEFNGSVPLFAAIDIGTAVTQVGSMELFLKGKNRVIRTLGALGTGASFAAPYAYFWANGDDYPWFVNAVAGGFVAIGVGIETDKTIRDKKTLKGLEGTDIPTV